MLRLSGFPRGLVTAGTLLAALAGTFSPAHAISYRTLFTPTGVAGEGLTSSVASAGDMNGDGYDDVIVGGPGNDLGASDGGRAVVFYGGPAADDVADLTLLGFSATEQLGFSVASAGDFNGDGFDDVIVGAPLNDTGGVNIGRAYLYFGGVNADLTADVTFTGVTAGDLFGYSVAGAGDVNGDGYGDVIVGAPLNDVGGAEAGRAYVFYGGQAVDNIVDITVTDFFAGDNFGAAVSRAGDFNGDGYGDFAVGALLNDAGGADAGAAFVFFGGPGEDNFADLTLNGAAAGDQLGFSIDGAGDVNGDGFDDLVAGSHLHDTGGANAGRASIYFGGPLADNVADVTLAGAAAGDQFGMSVARAGDANADGFADVIVGAPQNDAGGTNAGRAYIYFGGPAPNAVADIILTGVNGSDELGFAVAGAGDVNGDGFADVVPGARGADYGGNFSGRAYVTAIYAYEVLSPNGGETWVAGTPARVHWLGHDPADLAVSLDGGATWSTLILGAGGLDENEITVTSPGPATARAKVRLSINGQAVGRSTSDMSDAVFRIVEPASPPAAASRLQHSFAGAAGDNLGRAVAGAGDVNGDGFDDVIVGAPLNDAAGANAGRAYVFFGGPGGDAVADLTLSGTVAADEFGGSVAGAGDVNGDGFDDVIVGARFNDTGGSNAGRAYVYLGGSAPDAVADLTLTGLAANDQFGNSVGGAGDVNGDGFDDVIAGAPLNDTGAANAGQAYVFFGGQAPDATADLTLTGLGIGSDQVGFSVAGTGDVNGDGFADVMVSAHLNDVHGTSTGRALVYFGGAVPNTTVDLVLDGATAGDNFGISLAGAGDVNADGFADLLVGAPFNDDAGADAGRAYLYFGGPAPDAVPDLEVGGSVLDEMGFAVRGAGDVNGDGYADVIFGAHNNDAGGTDAGRAYVFHGGPAPDAIADRAIAGLGVGDQLGAAVAGAGDVNGDGFDDLIAGSYLNDAGGADAGAAYLHDSNRYFVLAPDGGETWNVGATMTVSWLGAELADLWLSVDGGASYQPIESGLGGVASNAVAIRVPHLPSRFARVKLTPSDAAVSGGDASDSLFTIQSSVALLNLTASLTGRGAELSWSTEPGVGPAGLAGYRLYRLSAGEAGNGSRVGPELIAEPRHTDAAGAPGHVYRLVAVNGLQAELELGRVALARAAPLAAWPLPFRGGSLNVSFGVNGLFGSARGEAVVELFDLSGRRVRTLARGSYGAGYRSVLWDGRDDRGVPVGGGIYFLRAVSAGVGHQIKVVVTR